MSSELLEVYFFCLANISGYCLSHIFRFALLGSYLWLAVLRRVLLLQTLSLLVASFLSLSLGFEEHIQHEFSQKNRGKL